MAGATTKKASAVESVVDAAVEPAVDAAAEPAVKDSVEAVVADGRTVIGAKGKKFGAGETVELSVSEAYTLTKLGFLMDPDVVVKKQTGPHISVSNGPKVRGA